jgi:hypothetical protein
MDRDERLQFMAAIIAAGICAHPDSYLNAVEDTAKEALEIAFRIEHVVGELPTKDAAK